MGIFSGKKKTHVSSVVYNLAGDEPDDRVDYLKYTALNASLQNRPIGASITDAYLRGRGMNFKIAFRYARDKFTWGLPNSNSRFVQITNNTPILEAITAQAQGQEVDVVTIESGVADYVWWAEREMATKYLYDPVEETMGAPPEGVHPDAVVSFDVDNKGTIYLEFLNPGSTTPVVIKLNPTDYVMKVNYVYALYRLVQDFITKEEVVSRAFAPGDTTHGATTITVVENNGEQRTTTLRVDMVTDGTTTTINTKETVEQKSRAQYFIYRLGSGGIPAIDSLEDLVVESNDYYPAIPLRVNNEDWTDEDHQKTPLYKTSKKLLDHLGLKMDEMSEIINNNPDVKDIDYGFVVQGVPINATTQASKLYLFEFFDHLSTTQAYNKPDWENWKGGEKNQSPMINVLEIFHPDRRTDNYNVKFQWQYVSRTNKAGTIFDGAKVGDVETSMGAREQWDIEQASGGFGSTLARVVSSIDGSVLFIRKQISPTQYAELEVCGLVYQNFVYNGKFVEITAIDAFTDPDEEGLLIPLNYSAFMALNIRWRTQLTYECSFIVFNCYKIVKQKWYQTGAFKIILAIIAIIIIVVTWGTATGPVASAYGALTAAIVAMGVNVLIAQIIAATLMYLASMIIMNILTKVGVKLFGETWGRVFAVIVMIVITWGMGAANAANVGANTAQGTITAVQILNGLQAVAQVVTAYSTGQQIEIAEDLTKLQETYDAGMKQVEEMSKEMLDTNLDMIDIESLIQTQQRFMLEGPGEFLQRTLMLGSEICDMTNGLVTNFAELGLQLELPAQA